MKTRINKIIISCVLLCTLLVGALCACNKERHPLYGKYYLEGSQDVYIEIIDSEYLQFVGVDFSFIDVETWWDGDLAGYNIDDCMQGVKEYIYWRDNQITVEVVEDSTCALAMHYDGDRTIQFNDINYILE